MQNKINVSKRTKENYVKVTTEGNFFQGNINTATQYFDFVINSEGINITIYGRNTKTVTIKTSNEKVRVIDFKGNIRTERQATEQR